MKMIRPAEAGLSADRLARLDAVLRERYLDTGKLPGFSTLIARRGGVAHFTAHGMADVARKKPMAQDTVLRIYSMTKPITSVALMMLVEEGKVALDHPVHRYIPAWKDLGVYEGGIAGMFRTRPPTRPMQIVDLLRHTSGLTYGFQYRTNVDAAYRAGGVGEIEKKGSLDDMIQQLAKLPLEFDPGAAWNYSVATDVVGHIVGVVAGMPFEDFLRTRIFGPLGMTETDFFVKPGLKERFAACYFSAAPGMPPVLQDDPEASRFLEPPAFISGGGGLVSTAADYLKFCEMILGGGRRGDVRLLSPKTIELMGANHLPGGADLPAMSVSLFSEAMYAGVGFGLGFSTTIDSPATLLPGSAGDMSWGGAASTYFWIDPDEDLIVIFMTQLMPSTAHPIRRDLRTLVYSAFED